MTWKNTKCVNLSIVQISSRHQIINQDLRNSFPRAPWNSILRIGSYVEYAVLDIMLLGQSLGLYMIDFLYK